jgi:hypothetical protein
MSLTASQISDILFKKLNHKAITQFGRFYGNGEEPISTYTNVKLSDIWTDYIPTTNPFDNNSSHGQIIGNVQYFNAQLINIIGTSAFSHPELKDIIAFNYGNGYAYSLKASDNSTAIPPGQNDWYLDNEAGVLIFMAGDTESTSDSGLLPQGVTTSSGPYFKCIKYIGKKGSDTGWGGGVAGTSGGSNINSTNDVPEGDNLYFTISRARTSISSNISGITYDNSNGIFSLDNGKVIPDLIDIQNGSIAYSWGNHTTSGYFNDITQIKVSNLSNTKFISNGQDINTIIELYDSIFNKLAPAKPPLFSIGSLYLNNSPISNVYNSGDGSLVNYVYSNLNTRGISLVSFSFTQTQDYTIDNATAHKFYATGDPIQGGSTDSLTVTMNCNSNSTTITPFVVGLNSTNQNNVNLSTTYGDYYSIAGKTQFWASFYLPTIYFNTFDVGAVSSSGTYTVNITHKDVPSSGGETKSFNFYVEDGTVPVISSELLLSNQAMTHFVSGVPTLITNETFAVSFSIDNGIKNFYPLVIGDSTVSLTSNQYNNLSGQQIAGTYNYVATHTITGGYTESITGSINGYDIFGGISSTLSTLNNYRIYTVSYIKAQTDSTSTTMKRYISPISSNVFESFSSNVYDLTAHQNSLIDSTYIYQLQLLNGVYQYPNTDYTVYGGANYTSLSGFRYCDFKLRPITNQSNLDLTFYGSTGITNVGQTNLKLYIKIEGVTGWLDANANLNSGTPLNDGDAAVIFDSDSSRTRRISFATCSGNVLLRVGTNSTSVTFTNFDHNK